MRWWRSVRVQGVALLAVLVALPLLVAAVLGEADDERRRLVQATVAEAGAAIGTGLAAELEGASPADGARIEQVLARYDGQGRVIRVLLRPEQAAADAFYLVAAAPRIPREAMDGERRMLLEVGALPGAAGSCDAPEGGLRMLPAGHEVLTAVVAIAGRAGCWAVVIGTDAARLRGVADPDPYWQRPEARAALAIYGMMAGLIGLIFAGLWLSLLRMGRVAERAEGRAEPGFAAAATVPELAGIARAFDAMVLRMRRGAEMLRQSAEANAHAFKGPIGTIRQALEPLRRSTGVAGWLAPVDAALNRLDGLVQAARVLDSQAADLLEPEMAEIDLSALVAAFAEGFAQSHPGRVVAEVVPGVGVRGQEEALETVLENLVENALGFAPPDRPVRISLRQEGMEAVLAVEDEGPGVEPALLGRIFERYFSQRPPEGEPGGATGGDGNFGIGLWLVRQNVRLMGGSVVAANRAPQGLSMTVRLPALD